MTYVNTDSPTSESRLPTASTRDRLALTDARSSDADWPALQRLSADDVAMATSALSAAYGEVTVVRRGASRALNMEVVTSTLPNITCGRLRISSSTVRT